MRVRQALRRDSGMTLIELVVAIVVIGITLTSMLALLASISSRSAEAMVQTQSIAIARAYLDEILGMAFTADGVVGTRSQYNDVQDYAFLPDQVPRTRAGAQMTGLNQYQVSVAIQNNVSIGVAPNNLPVTRITVAVTSPTGAITVLSGYRSPYGAQVIY